MDLKAMMNFVLSLSSSISKSNGVSLLDEKNKFNGNNIFIIDFLRERLKKDKSRIVDKRNFILYKEELKEFFSLVDNKNIALTYDYMNYNSVIHKEDIPLIFTIKKNGESLILKPQKKTIIPLDNKKEVWLYDKKIYLPTEKQLKY